MLQQRNRTTEYVFIHVTASNGSVSIIFREVFLVETAPQEKHQPTVTF